MYGIQARPSYEILPKGHIEKRLWTLAHALVLGVRGHTDDSRPAFFSALHLKAPTDGILTAPVSCLHGLIHDRDQRRVFVVGTCEFAAREQTDTQGGKVVRTDLVVVDAGCSSSGGW